MLASADRTLHPALERFSSAAVDELVLHVMTSHVYNRSRRGTTRASSGQWSAHMTIAPFSAFEVIRHTRAIQIRLLLLLL